jgi:hypothetical protein
MQTTPPFKTAAPTIPAGHQFLRAFHGRADEFRAKVAFGEILFIHAGFSKRGNASRVPE